MTPMQAAAAALNSTHKLESVASAIESAVLGERARCLAHALEIFQILKSDLTLTAKEAISQVIDDVAEGRPADEKWSKRAREEIFP